MSQQNTGKPDVEALENAASVIQREEQKLAGHNISGGAASKAKSLADKAADMYDESGTATINKKINLKNIDDAARTIQREESKICGGETPSSGAAAAAQSFAARVSRGEDPTKG
ncbi:uncharacterized protein OCT59_029066 [Rhizophagus irregularis]|uniref:SMP domain-containing protein n=3 Tax=Rhizophagus irregularis TaxID=588596 RepID=A0A916EF73_9GLOM|nr:hypothetical protein RirG_145160 [Rhizophagus irregularis DAOM 197198w]UZO08816.1 hypothetical protein OCT59_029066 [Rhizophagus irregularis]GBC34430.1 hypothetical protein RIR_jg37166.t1 [Rhizophagus irregularis DAOM 181602=DAOM 197198]CAB4495787.1 unnamed protein product [Rhizophagus irregularis]CAB5211565.1 unnamed protein product [Rhizophagus irregularis]